MPLFSVVISRHQTFPPTQVWAEDEDEATEKASIYWRHYGDDAAETDDFQLEAVEAIECGEF